MGCWKSIFVILRCSVFLICNTMGSKVDGLAVREDFLSKIAWKSPILADMILDHLTLEGASTHNFKDYDLFRRCFEKYGPWAFRWAMGRPSTIKIVRLAAIWKFFRGGHEKFQKTAFFAKNPSPRYFLMGKFFQDRTMSKLSSRGFRKCGTFWAYDLFNGSYCCSKSAQGSKSVFVTKNKRCQKNRHGHNFWIAGTPLNQRLGNTFFSALIQCPVWNPKIVTVSFLHFFYGFIFVEFAIFRGPITPL